MRRHPINKTVAYRRGYDPYVHNRHRAIQKRLARMNRQYRVMAMRAQKFSLALTRLSHALEDL